MLDPLIKREQEYIVRTGKKPVRIILGKVQIDMIIKLAEELKNMNLTREDVGNGMAYWRGMEIVIGKYPCDEDYIGFE